MEATKMPSKTLQHQPYFNIMFFVVLLFFMFFNSFLTNAASSQLIDRMGTHGMLLFSDGNVLYASHLPMFHRPHDKQVIFSFHLKNKKTESALIKSLTHNTNYWTLAPQPFDLNLLGIDSNRGVMSFQADLYSDHFERGGTLQYTKQTVFVRKLIINRRLEAKTPSLVQFIRVTPKNAKRHFYAQLIEGQPGVDRIFAIDNRGNDEGTLKERFNIEIRPLSVSNGTLAKYLKVRNDLVKVYYQEFGDLQ